jgi:group I intron endonuclease
MVIYKTTNLINGKQYIGKDTKNNSKYLGSGTFLKKAIKKYGRENFKKEILEYCNDENHLLQREEYWLKKFNVASNVNYYNCIDSSYGCPKGKHKGRKNTWSKGVKGHKGAIWDDKMKEKQSSKYKNRLVFWGDKISKAKKGQKVSEERRKKVSLSLKGRNRPLEAGKKKVPIIQYDLNNNVIKKWDSISDAQHIIGRGDIRACLKGKTKTAGGFIWRINDYDRLI